MQKSTFKLLSGAVRKLLREQEFCGKSSELSQRHLIRCELAAQCDLTTSEAEIHDIEKLVIHNFEQGWDDALYRRCAPGVPELRLPF